MRELEQFAQDLHQEVLVKCADDATPQMREDAFTECVLERLAEHNEADNADVCYHAATSRGRCRSGAAHSRSEGKPCDGAPVFSH